jgi:thiol-disulfide isomerase/thioredoxin
MNLRNILFVLFIAISSCQEPAETKTENAESKKVTDSIKLADLEGNPIYLSQYRGKTVFLNFWATWCKPCVYEIPSIKNAKDILTNKEIVFLLASDESLEQINDFKKSNYPDLNYVRLLNLEEQRFDALPTTYIFSPTGELKFAETGYRKWDDSTNIEIILKINNQK